MHVSRRKKKTAEKQQHTLEQSRKIKIKLISLVPNLHFLSLLQFSDSAKFSFLNLFRARNVFIFCAIHMFLSISGKMLFDTTIPVARGL